MLYPPQRIAQKPLAYYTLIALLLITITQLFHFNGLYGQDAYEYCRYANCWKLFFTEHQRPPDFIWPIYYPLIGSIFSFVFTTHFSLQLISIVSFSASGYILEKIIVKIYNTNISISRLWVSLAFLLSPYALRSSIVVMSDSLCGMLILCSLYWVIKTEENFKTKNICLAVCFMTGAIMTRYAAIVVIVPIGSYMISKIYRRIKISHAAISIVTIALLMCPYLYVHREIIASAAKHEWVQEWNILNLFKTSFQTGDGNYSYKLPNLLYILYPFFHPGFMFIGIFLLVFIKRKSINFSKYTALLITVSATYLAFLGGIPFQNMRFLLLIFPFVVLFYFPAFNQMKIYLDSKKWGALFVGLMIVIQSGLFARAIYPFYQYNKIEKNIAYELNLYLPKTLYTFSLEGALAYYNSNHKIISLSSDKFTNTETNSLLLFNEKKFSEEFKDKNPMINYNFIKSNKRLEKIKEFDSGWILYAIR